RILCRSESDCYAALGAIHRRWRAVPGRFKDYISGPKANGYRSIHTTVFGAKAMRVEVQIRTRDMHDVAESGIAAHWSYKNGEQTENPFAVDPFSWLRELVARLEKGDEPAEFLEHVKLDMFTDQVFCFTPRGDVVGLPRGASPIDFAYAIHTRVGDHCAGAMVDGRRVPLWTRLRNGQQVEIITAEGQRPSVHWIDMAKTGRAKGAIRRALRDQLREEQIALGRDIALQCFQRAGHDAGDKTLAVAAQKLSMTSVEAMLAAIARGSITAQGLVAAVYPDQPEVQTADVAPNPPSMRVRGLRRGQAVAFCTVCYPVPGDRVMGLARRGRVEVHAISCSLLAEFEDDLERWIDLGWDPDASAQPDNLARIDMTLANQPGALGHACTLIGERGANIDNLVISNRKPDFVMMSILVEVRDVKHLSDILTALRAQSYVSQAERTAAQDPQALPASGSAEYAGGGLGTGQRQTGGGIAASRA
ncbi:MAG: RelA/SpoT AH/RIS domain-containing protein, partial [Pseudomonadota bacterium]